MRIEIYSNETSKNLEDLIVFFGLNYKLKEFVEKIKNNNGNIFLLFDKERCVGFVSGYESILTEKEKLFIKSPIAEINNLYLMNEYKNEENYKLLLNTMEDYLKEKGYEYIMLKLDSLYNDFKLLEKLGYHTRKITFEKKI